MPDSLTLQQGRDGVLTHKIPVHTRGGGVRRYTHQQCWAKANEEVHREDQDLPNATQYKRCEKLVQVDKPGSILLYRKPSHGPLQTSAEP